MDVDNVYTQSQVADAMTKQLPKDEFRHFRNLMHIHSSQQVNAMWLLPKGITKGHVTYLCADNADTLMSLRNSSMLLHSFPHRSTSLIAGSHWNFRTISRSSLASCILKRLADMILNNKGCTLTKDMDSVGVVFPFLLRNPLTSNLSFLFLRYGSSITKWEWHCVQQPNCLFDMWQPLLDPPSS